MGKFVPNYSANRRAITGNRKAKLLAGKSSRVFTVAGRNGCKCIKTVLSLALSLSRCFLAQCPFLSLL